MITLDQYVTNPTTGARKPLTPAQQEAADDLLARVEALKQDYYAVTGRGPDIDPDTGTEISGTHGGSGDGGFRAPGSSTGAMNSSHRILPADKPNGAAVDCSDQDNGFDNWLTAYDQDDGRRNAKLEAHGLYREHPDATPTWCHLTTRAPSSGKRTFRP